MHGDKKYWIIFTIILSTVLVACDSESPEVDAEATDAISEPLQPAAQAGRVLLIGLDGTRAEALDIATTPNLDALRAAGFTDLNAITGDVSLSGPGWSSMVTGVWCDKHRVLDNDATWQQSRFDNFPHFITRLEQAGATRQTVSVSHWPPINEEILCADERNGVDATNCGGADAVITVGTDAEVRDAVVNALQNADPHVVFMQFDDVDHAGHGDPEDFDPGGFCPFANGDLADGDHAGSCTALQFNQHYLDVLETTDGYVGDIMAALQARPNFATENWLVLVAPDHGGAGQAFNQHGFPHEQDRRTFLIAAGSAAAAFPTGVSTKTVDIAATALFHLGIEIDPAWNLDGQPVGLIGIPAYSDEAIPSCFDQTNGMGDSRKLRP